MSLDENKKYYRLEVLHPLPTREELIRTIRENIFSTNWLGHSEDDSPLIHLCVHRRNAPMDLYHQPVEVLWLFFRSHNLENSKILLCETEGKEKLIFYFEQYSNFDFLLYVQIIVNALRLKNALDVKVRSMRNNMILKDEKEFVSDFYKSQIGKVRKHKTEALTDFKTFKEYTSFYPKNIRDKEIYNYLEKLKGQEQFKWRRILRSINRVIEYLEDIKEKDSNLISFCAINTKNTLYFYLFYKYKIHENYNKKIEGFKLINRYLCP